MLEFTGERIVPESGKCEPTFALKMYQEHIARYLFASQIAAGKRILDIGCGVGYGAQFLARSGAELVVAFDASESAVAHAMQFYPHRSLRYSVGQAEDFAFAEEFDIITCFELIEHVENPHRVLERISAALAPGGVLFMSTPRKLRAQRSAFHRHEMAFHEFAGMLDCYFSAVQFFVENNHLASLVTSGRPDELNRIYSIHSQFDIGQADYFIAAASARSLASLSSQIVLNDDSYVRNLENDVSILHRAEGELQEQTASLVSQNQELRKRCESETEARAKAERERGELEKEVIRCRDEVSQLRLSEKNTVEKAKVDLDRTLEELAACRQATELTKALRISDHDVFSEAERARDRRADLNSASWRSAAEKLSSEAANLNSRIAELESAVRQVNLEKQSAAAEVSRLRQQHLDDRLRAADLQNQISDFRRSFSWRVTQPARRMLDAYYNLRRGITGHKTERSPETNVGVAPNKSRIDSNFNSMGPGDKAAVLSHERPDLFLGRRHFDLVYVIGCHEGESKRYRVHNLVESIATQGYSAIAVLDSDIRSFVDARVTCRTLILFRCGWDERIELCLEYCHARQIPTVFDIDDFVFDPNRIDLVRVVATLSEEEQHNYRSGVLRYRKTLLACDYATCTTNYLAQLIEQTGRIARVIPNSLNQYQLTLASTILRKQDNKKVRIGYFSGSNTHQVDFSHCEEALLRVMSMYPEVCFVVGGILELGPQWNVYAGRVERLPFMPYADMLSELSGIDINLAPLEPCNPYCESKSQLKIFEAGLVSVPTVATAVASYAEAIDNGQDGLLVQNSQQWVDALQDLISSSDRRKEMGRRAHRRALDQFGPEVIASIAIEAYGLRSTNLDSRRESRADEAPVNQERLALDLPAQTLHISWVVPGLIIGGGGHRNILRAAYHLSRFGHRIDLYFTNTELSEAQLQSTVAEHFYPLHCPMFRYNGLIRKTDVIVATHWSTVDAAVRNRDSAREVMYFVQDFEPAFAPMGTEYILAENTYRLGLYHITSGPWCEDFLRHQFKALADHFLFPVDTDVYKVGPRTKFTKNIVFFAKPEMPRRCYELGIMALEELYRLKPGLEIILFGSPNVDAKHIPFKCAVQGVLPAVQDLADLYANADLGIVFSTTNPSLVPYEMMACGLPVIDLGRPGNEINYGGRRDIAFLADPQPLEMARQIADLLDRPDERKARSANGLEFVRGFPSEEQMARRVERLILDRLIAHGSLMSVAAV